MVVGDITLTDYGTHTISGVDVVAAAALVNRGAGTVSGIDIHLINAVEGQVQVLKTAPEGW